MGVSITRSRPNSSARPRYTPNAPPISARHADVLAEQDERGVRRELALDGLAQRLSDCHRPFLGPAFEGWRDSARSGRRGVHRGRGDRLGRIALGRLLGEGNRGCDGRLRPLECPRRRRLISHSAPDDVEAVAFDRVARFPLGFLILRAIPAGIASAVPDVAIGEGLEEARTFAGSRTCNSALGRSPNG